MHVGHRGENAPGDDAETRGAGMRCAGKRKGGPMWPAFSAC